MKNRLGCGVRGLGTRKVRTVAQRPGADDTGPPLIVSPRELEEMQRAGLCIATARAHGKRRTTEAQLRAFLQSGPARAGKTDMAAAAARELTERVTARTERRAKLRALVAAVMAQPSAARPRSREAKREAARKVARGPGHRTRGFFAAPAHEAGRAG